MCNQKLEINNNRILNFFHKIVKWVAFKINKNNNKKILPKIKAKNNPKKRKLENPK